MSSRTQWEAAAVAPGSTLAAAADAAAGRSRREAGADAPTEPASEELVVEDLLVEDVSIDGMCGVY
jgi:mycofactocin precursor